MNESIIRSILLKDLNFSSADIIKLEKFKKILLQYNDKYNFIGKSTIPLIWHRHFLDSAQLVKYISFSGQGSLSDLGSGAGFPGIVLAIYNKNSKFHVKLYEKSPVKSAFLNNVIKTLQINATVFVGNCENYKINSNYVVARAFKKLNETMRISREMAEKDHKLIILKGKSAQEEAEKASKQKFFKYKLENSITSSDSKILIINLKKSEKKHNISH
jgi:16S rRNA (guanine527-N7)-methyltransferase